MQERQPPNILTVLMVLMALLAMASGCSRTAPARFYLLSELPAAEPKAPAVGSGPCLTLGIGPVEMPDYLDRPHIVTQVSPNELQLGDFDQWAEPLGKTVMRTLAENLASLVCVEEVILYPSESPRADFQVAVTVMRFHGRPDGEVVLSAQWQVTQDDGVKVVARKRTTIREPLDGDGYPALVAAQSKALARLSREIAGALSIAPTERNPHPEQVELETGNHW
ncbi:MAG: PqiC family protein [Syntrophobacteraceae bacterium]|nr:PqiC family protein [Syntrophobacteraceae bacterium]